MGAFCRILGIRARRLAVGASAVALMGPLVAFAPTAPTVQAQAVVPAWMDTSLSAQQRTALLVAEMTLEEKVDLMTGNQGEEPFGFFNAAIPRVGIPALRMQDAGAGISPRGWSLPGTGQTATAMPSGIALGATWDPDLVPGYATVVGNEAKNTGGNVLLGPNADLIRQPWWGRINETESEDPFLTAALVEPFITAIQDNDLMATIKHPIAYNQELFRSDGQNALVSERALAEVHNLPFEAATRADVSSAMCSFNKINDVYSCENDFVLNDLLRGQGQFEGFVMTDFGAMHSTIPALEAGTDMETGTRDFYGGVLVDAVNRRDVDVALVDRSVTRILIPMFEHGLFDTDYTPSPIDIGAGSEEARKVQNQAITLLQNDDDVLPLAGSTESIAVIGADANIIASPGGASFVSPTVPVPALTGIEERAGSDITVTYSPGNDVVNGANMLEAADMTAVPSSVLAPASGGGSGLTAEYFANTDFSGPPALTRVDPQVNYDTGFLGGTGVLAGIYASQAERTPAVTAGAFNQSVRYTGTVTAPLSGTYKLNLTGWGDATLRLDGATIVDMTGVNGLRSVSSADLDLVAGQAYALQIEYVANREQQRLEPGTLLLQWSTPARAYSPAILDAAAAAAAASVAVVYVRTLEGEIRDRVSLKLPQSADQLITAVRAANPRTVVVLATAGAVTMPWLDDVPGVLQSYFGGQEEGSAIAGALFGDINPSGHLPITYPQSETAVPYGLQTPWAYPDPNITHPEGINIGYRGYAAEDIEPLFPFGHGLSYTSFDYSELRVTRADGGKPAMVRFRLTNTGSVGGAEVAQLYLGELPTDVETPVKQLAGFDKVYLDPGESELVTIPVPNRSLSYYDPDTDAFVTPEGEVQFFIGGSSGDRRLSGTIGGEPKAVVMTTRERYVDTRSSGVTFDGSEQAGGRLRAQAVTEFPIAGRGSVPADAAAVVMYVTAVDPTDNGFVTVFPCGAGVPLVSSLNYTPGVNIGNEIVAPMSDDGTVCVLSRTDVDLTVDVAGFVPSDSSTVAIDPARYLDTRATAATFDNAFLGAGRAAGQRRVQIAGRGDVPDDAAAVIVNVAAVDPLRRGFITIHPCVDDPETSSVNFVPGVNRANELIAPLDSNGGFCVLTSAETDVIADVVGYLPTTSELQMIAPRRVLDTRPEAPIASRVSESSGSFTVSAAGRLAAGADVAVMVAGRVDTPADAKLAVLNITVADPGANGFLSIHDCAVPRTNTSAHNYHAGVNGANEMFVELDASGEFCIFSNEATDLVIDIAGYIT